jgi:hypothetical protein
MPVALLSLLWQAVEPLHRGSGGDRSPLTARFARSTARLEGKKTGRQHNI